MVPGIIFFLNVAKMGKDQITGFHKCSISYYADKKNNI